MKMNAKRWWLGLLLLFLPSLLPAATGSAAVTVFSDSRDYTLEVVSSHGTPIPSLGTNTYAWHATVNCSVEVFTQADDTVYACTGWIGTGSIPAFGEANNTGPIVLTNVSSAIAWGWETYPSNYIITLRPGFHGDIVQANYGADYIVVLADGADFPAVTVVPDEGYEFIGFAPVLSSTVTAYFEATAKYRWILPGSGTQADPYRVENRADFDGFADSDSYWSDGIHTRLDTDIDLNPALPGGITYVTAPIAMDTNSATFSGFNGTAFSGVFDGNGHVIRNLTIDTAGAGNSYLGLFGRVSGSISRVSDLGIEGVSISGGDYSWYLGALCGDNRHGTISECYAIGIVSGGNRSSDFGGLCGSNWGGMINNCYTRVAVSYGLDSSVLGGLCGYNYGTVSNCYSTGAVSSDGASEYRGGLCGLNEGTISQSFWDKGTSGRTTSSGGEGKTTAQMQAEVTFTNAGWDFAFESANGNDEIWVMDGYPALSWQNPLGATHTIALHSAFHGSIVEADVGDDFIVTVAFGADFPDVTVIPNAGYAFTGFAPALPVVVTADFEATAQYAADDIDSDGLPDIFEKGIIDANPNDGITSLTDVHSDDDFDGDGQTNGEEFIGGTDPTNGESYFCVEQFYRNGRDFLMSWNPALGRVYSVYWTTNLQSGFQCLESNIPWTRGSFTNSASAPCGYYKIGVRLEN
jgi:hypothetical protein